MNPRRQTVATTYGIELGALAAPPECLVIAIDGPSMGAQVALRSPVVVGAERGADLVLADDRVSARHARVERSARGVRVTDLGSTNGILVNGALVREAELALGQTFTLGRSVVRVQPTLRATNLPPSPRHAFGELVGQSLAMRELYAVLELASLTDVTLLIQGDTGTGKELVARAVHDAGPRRKGPFVALDCGAMPESLLESALFGHVKGAFTGADQARAGAFVQAHGGTLFLDEISNLPVAHQARLLRALESRAVRPVGADSERAVDVRVVAASNADLEAQVQSGAFRPDLFYRLAVVRVQLPALAARLDDLPMLVTTLLARRGFAPGPIAGPGLDALRAHHWPGNVRELRNVLERALALSPHARAFPDLRIEVTPSDTPVLEVRTDLPYGDAKERVLAAFERAYVSELARAHATVSAMARAASMDRKTLRALLQKHGITRPED